MQLARCKVRPLEAALLLGEALIFLGLVIAPLRQVRWVRHAALAGPMLAAVLPVFRFPEPTGPYDRGTVTYHWADPSRPEAFTAPSGDGRELMVQVWLPADRGQEPGRALYAPNTDLSSVAELIHHPGFVLDHLRYVATNAQPGVPMAGGTARLPVALVSTGGGGHRGAARSRSRNWSRTAMWVSESIIRTCRAA